MTAVASRRLAATSLFLRPTGATSRVRPLCGRPSDPRAVPTCPALASPLAQGNAERLPFDVHLPALIRPRRALIGSLLAQPLACPSHHGALGAHEAGLADRFVERMVYRRSRVGHDGTEFSLRLFYPPPRAASSRMPAMSRTLMRVFPRASFAAWR